MSRQVSPLVSLTLALASAAHAQSPSQPAATPTVAPVQEAAPPVVVPQPMPAPVYGYYPQPVYPQAPAPAYVGRTRIAVGTRTVHQSHDPALWAPGLAMFLAGWIADFAILTPIANAVSTERDPAHEEDSWAWSLVPIIGPFAQLGLGAPHPAIPITTGLLQGAGVALFVVGLASGRDIETPIYADAASGTSVAFTTAPVAGGATVGLTLHNL